MSGLGPKKTTSEELKFPPVRGATKPDVPAVPAPPKTHRPVTTFSGSRRGVGAGSVPQVSADKKLETVITSAESTAWKKLQEFVKDEAVAKYADNKTAAEQLTGRESSKILPLIAELLKDKDNRNSLYEVDCLKTKNVRFKNSQLITTLVDSLKKNPSLLTDSKISGQPEGQQLFAIACSVGDSKVVVDIYSKLSDDQKKTVLQGGYMMNQNVKHRPLYAAVQSGNLATVQFLLDKQAEFNKTAGKQDKISLDSVPDSGMESSVYSAVVNAVQKGQAVTDPVVKIALALIDRVAPLSGVTPLVQGAQNKLLNDVASVIWTKKDTSSPVLDELTQKVLAAANRGNIQLTQLENTEQDGRPRLS